jgi:single-strand DNA-binding protein
MLALTAGAGSASATGVLAAEEFWRIPMVNEAQISLTGYVATQPLAKTLKNGVTTLTMRVAWTPRRRDRVTGEWMDGQTSYVTVNCWRRLATNVAVCVRKGDPVAIQGRISVRPFQDKEGRQRISVEIEASSVAHDLNQGVSQFSRLRPQTGMTATEYAASRDAAGEASPGASGGSGRNGDSADDSGAAGSAVPAAIGNWADGENEIPMPDEPAFFDGAATGEATLTDQNDERATEAVAS